MPASYLGRRRSRPVADAPAPDGAELAKAWLVELVAIAPLERAARLPGPRFAEDAPRLCAAVVAALASDAAFDELDPGGALAPLAAGAGHLAAARGPVEAVGALEALRTVTWAALVDAARRPVPGQLADLADRLGAAVAVLTAAALESPDPPDPSTPDAHVAPALPRRDSSPEEASSRDAAPAGDALAEIEAALRDAANAADPLAEAVARLRALGEPAPAPASPQDPFAAAATRLRAASAPLEEPRIRRLPEVEDAGGRGPEVEDATDFSGVHVTPWGASIERRVARHRGDGLPFSVLCLELVDADRLVAADIDQDVVEVLEQAEAAVLGQLRPADALIRERPGRYWLTTPDADAADGRRLAHRIAAAVEDLPPHRGAPLQAAIGVTSCPADATDARTLEHRADEALFAARAGGTRVAGPSAS